MFQIPRISLPNPLGYFRAHHIDLPAVKVDDIETSSDRRARTLKHLLKANHANFSIIYHNLKYHNHAPHILGSAYLLGATSERLNHIYDNEATQHEPWQDAPGEVTGGDWRNYLGRKEYQRAFIDFFEDELVHYNYGWKALLHAYLFEGHNPIANNLFSGLAHPVIHLGYGYELNSQTVAIEGLAMSCCFYNDTHKYFDDPSYSRPPSSSLSSTSPLELLEKIRLDKRFDALNLTHQGSENTRVILEKCEDVVLQYWNAWTLPDPKEQFRRSQEAAVALLVGTHNEVTNFDFYFVHVLTSSHAVRVMLPLVPSNFELSLVRQWWFFTIITYICQLRPKIEISRINDYDLKSRGWKDVDHLALGGKARLDAHYVKALRAMKDCEKTWGENGKFFLKAAMKFGNEFSDWFGFGLDEESEQIENGRH